MALIKKCMESGTYATVLVNPDSKRLLTIPEDPHINVIKCGLEDYKSLDCEENANADAFFHLAWGGTFGDARNDKALQEKNAEYAADAARLAHRLGCKTFIGAGSQAEYGRISEILKDDTPCNPENEYGRAKLSASYETRKICHELGMRHVWARILSVYGPYDGMSTMVMSLISSLLEGKRPALTKGEQMWDYLYAGDAANALFLLAEKGKDGGIYPLGSGVARPLREYIEITRDAIDQNLPLGFGEIPYSEKQVMYLCADISKLMEDTGFKPSVSFEEGVRQTIDYVKVHQRS